MMMMFLVPTVLTQTGIVRPYCGLGSHRWRACPEGTNAYSLSSVVGPRVTLATISMFRGKAVDWRCFLNKLPAGFRVVTLKEPFFLVLLQTQWRTLPVRIVC